ncbi:DUF1120 domain-containing protein [Cupriavidus plantarum]|nr:DUF1120 domain-containing protein [Cupriavidus plantarum]
MNTSSLNSAIARHIMVTTFRNTALVRIACILCTALAGGAHAAESAQLTIRGVIKPSACTPTLSGGGIVDFGTIPVTSLSHAGPTRLPAEDVALTITCDTPTKVGVVSMDNRAGTADAAAGDVLPARGPDVLFGLNAVGGRNVGAYNVQFSTDAGAAVADSEPVDVLRSERGGAWRALGTAGGTAAANGANGNPTMFTWAGRGAQVPGAYRIIAQTIRITVAIAPALTLPPLTRDIPIDGSATFSIRYL